MLVVFAECTVRVVRVRVMSKFGSTLSMCCLRVGSAVAVGVPLSLPSAHSPCVTPLIPVSLSHDIISDMLSISCHNHSCYGELSGYYRLSSLQTHSRVTIQCHVPCNSPSRLSHADYLT